MTSDPDREAENASADLGGEGSPADEPERLTGPITYGEVRETLWRAGGERGRATLEWLEPVVSEWEADTITAADIGDLLLLGSDPGGQWDMLTSGSYRIRDALAPEGEPPEIVWDPAWSLIAVRDPESGERLLLDGNARALALWWAVSVGVVPAEARVRLVVGHLHTWAIRVCKPLSPLWR